MNVLLFYFWTIKIRFRDRLQSMGKLHELTTACSDTCCDGLNNPNEHVMKKLFPGLTKGPLADPFHKVQLVTDAMVAGHDDYALAAKYGDERVFSSF